MFTYLSSKISGTFESGFFFKLALEKENLAEVLEPDYLPGESAPVDSGDETMKRRRKQDDQVKVYMVTSLSGPVQNRVMFDIETCSAAQLFEIISNKIGRQTEAEMYRAVLDIMSHNPGDYDGDLGRWMNNLKPIVEDIESSKISIHTLLTYMIAVRLPVEYRGKVIQAMRSHVERTKPGPDSPVSAYSLNEMDEDLKRMGAYIETKKVRKNRPRRGRQRNHNTN